jgi:Fe-S oxidoreductase
MGMGVEKIRSQKQRTLCCGEGGSVGCVRPDLGRQTPTIHLADLIFDTSNTLSGRFKTARAPFTYLHRIQLKNKFKKHLAPAVQQERVLEYGKASDKRQLVNMMVKQKI